METVGIDYKLRRRRFSVVLLILIGAISFVLIAQIEDLHSTDPPERPVNSVIATKALDKLEVRSASRGEYVREDFSPGWSQIAGCDMRNRILQRDLIDIEVEDDNCTVTSGVLPEAPFTGDRINFNRGAGSSQSIHIDHIVPVSDAWRKGAQQLEDKRRHDFYNDPLNLIAVDSQANLEKSDEDASAWLPRIAYRCRYIARQIAVKTKYNLWVTRPEYNAMLRVLKTCPEQVLPIIEPF